MLLRTAIFLSLLPTALLAQTTVGLRAGLATFRDNKFSVYRYVMPSVGVQLTRAKTGKVAERLFQAQVDWGQREQVGRYFQRTGGLSVSWQRTYGAQQRAFRLGWQAQLGLRTYYDCFQPSDGADSHIGGYVSLELAPVLAYRTAFRLAGRTCELTNYLSLPVLTGAVAGTQGDDYGGGVYLPGTFTGLTNQLWLTPNAEGRWRIGYGWQYRALKMPFADQQHALNTLSLHYRL